MFGKIAAFEIRYQLRQPLFWIVFGVFFLLAFGIAGSDVIRVGGVDNVHRNSPFAVAIDHAVMAVFFMFVTTAFVANAVLRDDETGFGPILRATRLSKFDYLYGRFGGSLTAAVLCYAAVPLGIMVGAAMPWVDPELKGPFIPAAFAFAFFAIGLPGILFTGTLFFTLATVTRSMAWTFVGVIALIVAYLVGNVALGKPELEPITALWDPFGLQTYGLVTKYWTPNERNTLVPALEGVLLTNRLMVLGAATLFLLAAYPLYSLRTKAAGEPARRRKEDGEPAGPAIARTPPVQFGKGAALAQLVARTRLDMGQVFKSPVFLILLGLGLFNSIGGLWFSTDDTGYGGALWPVTRTLIPVLNGSFAIFPLIIAVFYAGELVWRERDRRTHEIIDAAPLPDWAFVIPKTAAVVLVLFASLLVSVLAATIIQTIKGYTHFEFGKYLAWYVLPWTVDLFLVSAMAVFLQVISPNKFVGWGLMVLYIVALFAFPRVGLEHNLYNIGGVNTVPLSDMDGQGRFWIGAWWMRLYWSAFAVILLVFAYALWRRGTENRYAPLLRRLPRRLRGRAGWTALAAAVIFVGTGGFIYVNTNVWNTYRTDRGDDAFAADYERALLRYENLPQPSVAHVRLAVDIRPDEPLLETRGTYVLENRTGAPLREVHVRFDRELEVGALSVEGAWARRSYDRFNYRIFAFSSPMQPGEKRLLTFTTRLAEKGFRNSARRSRDLVRVVDNGTFVNSTEIAPLIGMSRDQLLRDRAKRRRNGLPQDLRPAKLGDPVSRNFTYVGRAGWTSADITVTTDADQTPIAPGYKVSEAVKHGRRTVRFVTDAPILQFFSIQSGRYRTQRERYKGVDFTVYYDPQHSRNVARMMRALEASLDYYQANFSPFQFRQARIVEFPEPVGRFAQSFAGTFAWSEGLGFIADYRDPEKIDMVTYVAAHEFGHQWWAHQVVGADQQGATSLSETLAQYSALRVMRQLYGPDRIQKFLKYELDAYLRARGAEGVEELPLERVEDQPYIHYRKGSLVMYRLADEIGEEAVNRALRRLIAQYAFKGPPYPTALDLVSAIRAEAPADKQQLITDLFEKITLYDLKAKSATARRRPDGRYDVTLTVDARKLYASGRGQETAAPMSEALWLGVFTEKPGKKAFGKASVQALERRPVRTGLATYRFVVDTPPKYAGVDPYNLLIDRNSDDNVVEVK